MIAETLVHAPFTTPAGYALDGATGSIQVWVDRPGWLLSRVRGRFEPAHCDALLAASDRAVMLAPRARWVHDWREMTTFDIAVPPRLVGWTLTHVRSVSHATIVTRSPLISMAARAANLTLKNVLRIGTDDAELDRALVDW